jgi:ABC-type transport system involved in multi-copper enzyme maturation permease subunit
MAGITLREAMRRKILWTALAAGALMLVIFAVALKFQVLEFQGRAMSPFLRYQVEAGMLMIGLYTCDLVAVVMAIVMSIDTLAGEIGSGTIHAIATKPIARWQIFLGKFLGFAGMVTAYVALTFTATIAVAWWVTGVMPEHPMSGFLLIDFECLIALSVSFLLGTWVSTLTNGALVLGLQGLAFMGGWLEQVSGFSLSPQVVTVGVVSSLIMPGESLWRRAAFEMQTPLAGSLSFSPFANVSIPSMTAVGYAGVFLIVVLAAGMYRFQKRDL